MLGLVQLYIWHSCTIPVCMLRKRERGTNYYKLLSQKRNKTLIKASYNPWNLIQINAGIPAFWPTGEVNSAFGSFQNLQLIRHCAVAVPILSGGHTLRQCMPLLSYYIIILVLTVNRFLPHSPLGSLPQPAELLLWKTANGQQWMTVNSTTGTCIA